jgi:hypothetical protein
MPKSVTGLTDWLPRKMIFNYQQAIANSRWVITHNLGVNPIISVFVNQPIQGNPDNTIEITPDDITIVDDNTVILEFNRSWSGTAQLVGRQSDPDLLNPLQFITVEATEQPLQQFSSSGEITIATLAQISQPTIQLSIRYTGSTGAPIVRYGVDDQTALNSPWNDFNRVLIKGKIYIVRSFNAIIPEMASGVVTNGANFQFIEIDKLGTNTFEAIQPTEVLILLASSPYQNVDKIRDQYIDVTSITDTTNPFGLSYNNGEFFADPLTFQTVYPLIRSV